MSRFCLPRDIYHGKGCLEELKNLKGSRAMLVVGGGSMKRQGFLDKAVDYLKEGGMEVQVFEGVEPDPSVETVMKGAEAMKAFQPDWIVAMGGGSPIDAAKAMWAFYEYPDVTFEALCTPFNFPELRQKAKFAAIPSTSGTATEVTAFSVITDYQTGVKYPLADFNITPDVAIVDPDLVAGLPVKQVAYTGMDALTHAIEAYSCLQKNPISQCYALSAIKLIVENLEEAIRKPKDKKARISMAIASYIAGAAFSNSMVGIVHAIGHSVGGVCSVAHGEAMTILLPVCMRYNLGFADDDYADLLLYLSDAETYASTEKTRRAEKAVEVVEDFISRIKAAAPIATSLSERGVRRSDFEQIAIRAMNDGALIVNPRSADKDDILKILEKAF